MAAAVMVAGGAYSWYQSRQAGKMQMEIAEMNAALAQDEAQFIMQQAEWEVEDKREEMKRLMATQRARAAASGITITSGAVVNAVLETVEEGEEDIYRIRQRALAGSYSKKMEAASMIFQGRIARAQSYAKGDQALVGSLMTAGQWYTSPATSDRTEAGTQTFSVQPESGFGKTGSHWSAGGQWH